LPSISIISSFKTGQALENHGEALWRKLVERKMMTGMAILVVEFQY
jgi:hypothetical protein